MTKPGASMDANAPGAGRTRRFGRDGWAYILNILNVLNLVHPGHRFVPAGGGAFLEIA